MESDIKRIVSFLMSLLIIFSLVVEPVLVDASQTNELSGEIEVIFNRNEADMQPYIEAFEKKYPGVKVKYTCYNDLEKNIKMRWDSGDYGDVLYFPSFISTEEASLYFEPLGNYDELSLKYNYLDQGRHYDNIVYGVPSSAYLLGIIYNKEVFHKAGITNLPDNFDDFLYAMYLINEHTDAIPFYCGYKENWVLNYWQSFPFIEMSGDRSYRYNEFISEPNPFAEGTIYYKTVRLLYELVKNDYTEVTNEPMAWWDSIIKVNSGEIGCSVIGTWALYDYKNVGAGSKNIAFMPFPNNIDGTQYVTVAGDYSYAVSKNSKNKDVAKAFVYFMLDESGYAFNHDTLSVLKTEPIPECYGDLENVVLTNSSGATAEGYALYNQLSANFNIYDVQEYVRIVESAAGISDESFDDIMNDWNIRWESGRDGTIEITDQAEAETEGEEDFITLENNVVEFSEVELNYINEKKLIKIGYHNYLAPLSYNEKGKFKGIAREICDYIYEKSGLSMEFVGFNNNYEMMTALENGEIDIISGIEKFDNIGNLKYSKQYVEYMDVIIRHNTSTGSSLNKFANIKGELLDYEYDIKINNQYFTLTDALISVDNMDDDFTISNYYSANYYLREENINDLVIIPYVNNKSYHIGFKEDTNPILIAICNKCLYSINDGEIEIKLMDYMDKVVQKVSIMTFIKTNPLLCISVITLMFLMTFIIFYQSYKAKTKQALDAKKYKMLAALADEYFFEYNYLKERFKFDEKFQKVTGFERRVERSSYDENNKLLKQFVEQLNDSIDSAEDSQFTIVLNDEKEIKHWYRVVTSVVRNDKNQPILIIGKMMNIQKEMEEVTNYQNKAYRDSLTKLYNREGLSANMPKDANGVMLAVMDLDDFKTVNDTLGHDGGDYALMYFADKLEEHMGTKSLLARYGGDEFIVLLTGVSESEAQEKLEELVKSMDVSLRYAGNTKKISISVGAVYSDQMSSFETMFHEADKVLYKTKQNGKNSYKLEVK